MSEYVDQLDDVDILAGVRTGDYLERTTFPALSWAVPGLIPEGFGLFTGAPKTGKSWAALGIALAVAEGGAALGKVPTGPARPVLLLALEDGERRLKGRCRVLLDDGAAIPGSLHYVVSCRPGDVLPIIRRWLELHGDERPLVVLDTLGKTMPPAMPGEGAYNRDYRIGSALKALVDAHPGATLLVVHHVRKATSEDWMDSTSGTNGLNGAADFTLNLVRRRNSDAGELRVTGRDVAEAEYAVTVLDGRWTLDGDDLTEAAVKAEQARQAANLGDDSADVLRFVHARPAGARAKDVAEHMGWDENKARPYLARLVDAGRLNRASRGLYTSVTNVTSVTNEPTVDVTLVTDVTVCSQCLGALDDVDGTGVHVGCAA